MQTFRNKLIVIAVLGILVIVGCLMGPRPIAAAGGPNVTIEGPLPLPVRTVVDAFQPVLAQGSCNAVAPVTSCAADVYTVPAGKRLVVEYFSVLANLNSVGDTARIRLQPSSSLTEIYLPLLPPAVPGPITGAITSGGQAVRVYFEPLTVVQGVSLRNGPVAGTGTFSYQISGYLVNVTP